MFLDSLTVDDIDGEAEGGGETTPPPKSKPTKKRKEKEEENHRLRSPVSFFILLQVHCNVRAGAVPPYTSG